MSSLKPAVTSRAPRPALLAMLALPCPADDSPGPVRRPHGLSPLTSASRSVPRAPHVAGTGGRLPRNTLAPSDRAATGNRQVVRGRSRHRPRRCARACPGGRTHAPSRGPAPMGGGGAGLGCPGQHTVQLACPQPTKGRGSSGETARLLAPPAQGSTGRKAGGSPATPSQGRLARDSPGGSAPTGLGPWGLRDEGVTEGTS